ncbi:alpha/beta hydrolase [bacterium]|nr:MAG: alpha/beta hydrolase [bacterium]
MFLYSESLFTTKNNIHYFDSGEPFESKGTLLIFHGLFGGLSNFDDVIQLFSKQFRVLLPLFPIFDKPGFQSFSDLIRAANQFLDDIVVNHPVHIIGNSLGGQLAIQFFYAHPQKVDRLILTGSAGLGEQSFGITKPKRHSRSYIEERTAEVFYAHTLAPSYIDEIMDVLGTSTKLIRLLRIARTSKQTRLDSVLPSISCPVLLLWGKDDAITPPETAHLFHQLLPDSTLKWIEKCGHAPMTEHPNLFYSICTDFLQQQSNKPMKDYQYVGTNYSLR